MEKKLKKKKLKSRKHVTYNQKGFLAPDSIRSMAVIHTKIKDCGEASVVISDCINSIKLWNDLNNQEEKAEMIRKTTALIQHLTKFQEELTTRL